MGRCPAPSVPTKPMPTRILSVWLMLIACYQLGSLPVSFAEAGPAEVSAETEKPATESSPEKTPPAEGEASEVPVDPNANPVEIIGEEAALPNIQDLPLPTSGELLQSAPFDWVVLNTDKVVIVEPVAPRPDTLLKLEEEYQRLNKLPLPKKEDDPVGREELLAKRNEARFLKIALQEGEEVDFSIERKLIKEVIHFEDLILRRVDQLLAEVKPGEAYELLELVYDREPQWPGIDKREQDLLFAEAKLRDGRSEPEDALGFVERLHARNGTYPNLEELAVKVTGTLHREAIENQDYRRARFFLKRLIKLYADQSSIKDREQELAGLARNELDVALESERKSDPSTAVLHAETAIRIWPTLPELRGHFERMHTRFQRIRIGVVEHASTSPGDRLFTSAGDRRVRLLTQVPLFNVERQDGVTLRYRSQVIDEWEPTDLGRSIRFYPRFRRRPWESLAVFSSSKLVEQILEQIDPHSPVYDERLDNLINGVEFHSPQEFEVNFSEVPLNPAALLTFDVLPADSQEAAAVSLPQHGVRFTLVNESGNEHVFERVRPETPESALRHVARITEVRYPDRDLAVQGMIRGEVEMLDDLQPWDIRLLEKQANVFVLPYVIPATHVIQYHPRSKYTQNRALRRALSLALDRIEILDRMILRGTEFGRLTTAPFRSKHPGYNQTLESPSEDPRLAISMFLAARKELGGELPPLKLAIADSPNPPEVVEKLKEAWKKVGIQVEVVSTEVLTTDSLNSDAPAWDMVYRIVHLTDPQVDLWPFLTFQKRPTVDALSGVPAWLRQKLLLLDQAGDYDTANERLRELHQLLWAEAELLPLWEIDEYLAARKHLRGLPDLPMYFYQNVEQWRSLPWVPPEVGE